MFTYLPIQKKRVFAFMFKRLYPLAIIQPVYVSKGLE